MTFDESKYERVSELVKRIELEDQKFNLFGINYTLFVRSPETEHIFECLFGDDLTPATNIPRDEHRCEVYLQGNYGEKIRKPLLFHEIVESYFMTRDVDVNSAHNLTLPQEKRFCEEYLTESELEKYLRFKKEWGCDGFEPIKE